MGAKHWNQSIVVRNPPSLAMPLTAWFSNMPKNPLPLHTTIDARQPHTRGTGPAKVLGPELGRLVDKGLMHVGREGVCLQLDKVFLRA